MATVVKKKRDLISLFIHISTAITWILLFIAMIFYDKAKPETQTILDIRYNKTIRDTWDMAYVELSFGIFVTAAVFSILMLIVNLASLENSNRRFSFGLLLGFLLAVTGSLAYYFGVF